MRPVLPNTKTRSLYLISVSPPKSKTGPRGGLGDCMQCVILFDGERWPRSSLTELYCVHPLGRVVAHQWSVAMRS